MRGSPVDSRERPIVLGIETSCDDTACALLDGRGRVLASVVSSQVETHRPFGGVVPELASREHLQNWPVVSAEALGRAGVGAVQLREKDLDAEELLELATAARRRLPDRVLLVNGRADVALAAAANGVHLPASGLPVAALRRCFGAPGPALDHRGGSTRRSTRSTWCPRLRGTSFARAASRVSAATGSSRDWDSTGSCGACTLAA